MKTDQLIKHIQRRAKRTGKNQFALSAEAGLAKGTLKCLWDEDWSPTIRTLRKLERYLNTVGGRGNA